jgi:hypothetical protein
LMSADWAMERTLGRVGFDLDRQPSAVGHRQEAR